MNRTLKRWLLTGDEKYCDPFNLYYQVKRMNEAKPKNTGWINKQREQRFNILKGLSLNRWMNNKDFYETQNGKDINNCISSVFYNIIGKDRIAN